MSTARTTSARTGLDCRLLVQRPGFVLDLALTASPGQVLALLGPNGAGKSTALRTLAGLIRPDGGRTVLDGVALDRLPAERRRAAVVFQDHLLFPHLSILENVAFGPRCQGLPAHRARAVAADWLDRFGLTEHAATRPGRLSGGQAQRAALARALAAEPRLLLLDEPLAALDATTRPRVRAELRRHLAGFDGVTVLVTHDPLDAMALADQLVVVEAGRLVQQGPPEQVARAPRSEYVAGLVGLNLYRGTAAGRTVTLDGGGRLDAAEACSGPVLVTFPPSAVALFRTRPDGTPRNVWATTVAGVESHGDRVRVRLGDPLPAAADVTPAALAELGLVEGRPVWAAVKAVEVRAYPG